MDFIRIYGIITFFIFYILEASAQTPNHIPSEVHSEVTEAELDQFAGAFNQIRQIDMQVQQEMIDVVHEEEIDINRFNEYLISLEDSLFELNASGQELEKFKAAFEGIEAIQDEALKKIDKAIADNSLTVERYQKIAAAIQASPVLLNELKKKFGEY